jgi:hypothetical protein
MAFSFDAAQIASATNCQQRAVAEALPYFTHFFEGCTFQTVAAALATLAAECSFHCIEEKGNIDYFKMYNNRPDLGNVGQYADSGYQFRGRGYIQLTGVANYKKYGDLLKLDLLTHPELALVPANAANIFWSYFQEHGCPVWAERGNWRKVRKLVNGGLNGWVPFQNCVYNLLDLFYS